jgi:NAD+ diphosphatase
MTFHSIIFFQEHFLIADKTDFEKLQPFIIRELPLENHYYCAEVHTLPPPFQAQPLRPGLAQIELHLLALTIKAYNILRWDRLHQFCGACGIPTIHYPPLYERKCLSCNISYFPRISPCIIVRINKGQQLLMARSPHFAAGVYGLIAGFIEPGETAEQAVHREVYEEVGIKIKHLKYFDSQPWPFPDALMLGYTAEYESGELMVDTKELETAGWYPMDALPGRPSNPRSIASRLIDDFIQHYR